MSEIPHKTPTPQPTPPPFDLIKSLIGFFNSDWFILMLIIIAVISSIIVIVYAVKKYDEKKRRKDLLFKDKKAGNFFIIMYRLINGTPTEIERLRMNIKDNKFVYNGKDFSMFDKSKVAFTDKKNNYYAFDYDDEKQLVFNSGALPKDISKEDIDVYVNRGIIAQIVQALEKEKGKGQYLMLIVGGVFGLAIGLIVGMYL